MNDRITKLRAVLAEVEQNCMGYGCDDIARRGLWADDEAATPTTPPHHVTLHGSQKFVRDHCKRIIADPASATEAEIVELAMVAVRLRDWGEAEQNAITVWKEQGLEP